LETYPLLTVSGFCDMLKQIDYINMVDTLKLSGYSVPSTEALRKNP